MNIALQDTFGRQYPLEGLIKIGSDSANHIVLLDSSVAQFHVEVHAQGEAVRLQVLSEEKNTWVNNKRVKSSKIVKPGDVIEVGKVIFTVVDRDEKTVPPPPVSAESSIENHPQPPVEPPVQAAKKMGKTGLIILIAMILLVCIGSTAAGFYFIRTNPDIQAVIVSLTGSSAVVPADGEGPAVLNLNAPQLNTVISTSFIQNVEDTYAGVDANHQPLTIQIKHIEMEQSSPEWSNYSSYVEKRNNSTTKDTEFSILKNTVYLKSNNTCSVFADEKAGNHKPANWPKSSLHTYVDGKARKIESGVMVNGIATDKYQINLDNSAFASSIDEIVTGELYRAQNGGYLVKLLLVQKWAGGKWPGTATYGFDANQPVTVTHDISFTYYPTGKLKVIVPGVCAGQLESAQ